MDSRLVFLRPLGLRLWGQPGQNWWPWSIWPDWHDGWTHVFTIATQPYVKNLNLIECPSDSDTGRWGGRNGMSYGYNEYLYDANRGWNRMAKLGNAPGGPASVSILVETFASGIYNDWDNGGPVKPRDDDGMTRVRYGSYDPWSAHHDGGNVTYADGHAKFVPQGAVTSRKPQGSCVQVPIVDPNCTSP